MRFKQRKVGEEKLLKIVVFLFSLWQADDDADGNLLPPDHRRVGVAALVRQVEHFFSVPDAQTYTKTYLTYLLSVFFISPLLVQIFTLTSEAWGHAEDWWPGYGAIAVGNCWTNHYCRRSQVTVGEWPTNCSEMLQK